MVSFCKMQAIGNDFIIVESKSLPSGIDKAELSRKMCDRHFGIGSDGLLLLEPSDKAPWRMIMLNVDGTEGHCGNGLRCLARYIFDKKYVNSPIFEVETIRGVQTLEMVLKDGVVDNVVANMGVPILERSEIPVAGEGDSPVINLPINIEGTIYNGTCLSMGNPHAVIFCEDPYKIPLESIGPKIENHPLFPERTNVEFVSVESPQKLIMRIWERGCAITLGSGSGSSASTAAAKLNNLVDDEVEVSMPGGTLKVQWKGPGEPLYSIGPAHHVFTGEFIN